MKPVVKFSNVSKKIQNLTLLDNVSFDIMPGEITTLIGQNGAGKTTIAKMILNLDKPDTGDIILQSNIKIGYIPQKLDFSFNMPMTCRVLLKILVGGKIDKNIIDLDLFVDYIKIKNKDISEISGGQLQKLLLVGALLAKPDLLILDEPTQFLDVTSQQKFYHILNIFKERFKTTIFMISHDLFTVMKKSDQVICLNKHVCCSGKPSSLQGNELQNMLSEIGIYVHHHDHNHN